MYLRENSTGSDDVQFEGIRKIEQVIWFSGPAVVEGNRVELDKVRRFDLFDDPFGGVAFRHDAVGRSDANAHVLPG